MSNSSDLIGDAPGKRRSGNSAPMPAERVAAQSASERRSADVALRRVPRQSRGTTTFNNILDAAAQTLEVKGPEGMTTNLVADQAGVNIATLYQYFPSKESILLALFQRDVEARIRTIEDGLRGIGDNDDWRSQFSEAVDRYVDIRRNHPGGAALGRAMRGSIDLHGFERQAMLGHARTIAAELIKRGRVDQTQAELVAICLSEVAGAHLDIWALGYAGAKDAHENRILEEFKKIAIGYLAPYLDP